MFSPMLPKPIYTGQEYSWGPNVYVLDTVSPVSWRVFNLRIREEELEYEQFVEEGLPMPKSNPRALARGITKKNIVIRQ